MECSVCLEPYDDTARRPKSLPCGHTVCQLCVQDPNFKKKCPVDRKVSKIALLSKNVELWYIIAEKCGRNLCNSYANYLLLCVSDISLFHTSQVFKGPVADIPDNFQLLGLIGNVPAR